MILNKEAREAMAKALVFHEYGKGSWEAFDERERDAWREQVDTYFKFDPLRHLLGTKAVEALLAGEAGVFAEKDPLGDPIAGHFYPLDGQWMRLNRLDTPSEPA